jgi:L-lactate dehydrogenase complex protein LldG
MQMYSLVARSPHLFAVSQKFAALGTRLVSPFSEYVALPPVTGWGYSKDLPRFAGKTFHDRWGRLREVPIQQLAANAFTRDQKGEGIRESTVEHRDSLAALFAEEFTKVNGNIVHTNAKVLTDDIIVFLQARGVDQIHLEPNVLDEAALAKAGIAVSGAPDAAFRVGVTRAVCGLADTGSIVIVDGEGNPLQASLLPRVHIAVLCESKILPTLADAMRLPILQQSRAAVVITGPSRTADIEMSLTIGMHGPGELHVFLVHTIC